MGYTFLQSDFCSTTCLVNIYSYYNVFVVSYEGQHKAGIPQTKEIDLLKSVRVVGVRDGGNHTH